MSDLELTEEEQAEADKQVRKILEWLDTDEGAASIRAASERSKRSKLARSKARRVNPLDLLKRTPGT